MKTSILLIVKQKIRLFKYPLLIIGIILVLGINCKKDEPPAPLATSVTDMEGNVYKIVTLGDQTWMAENLKVTKLNDGTPITAEVFDITTPGYCWPDGLNGNKDVYGALYNWYSINSGKLCPAGWHVPSRTEWQQLRDFLGDTLQGGGKLKEAGTVHWLPPNKGADNSSGFTALPAGIRYFEGSFASLLNYTCFWSATETGSGDRWYIGLYYGDSSVVMDHRIKTHGFSVRCLKD
jgi:uncharacterized protein (TIGR02145 family)